jgi:hypothetical protein
MSDRSRSRSPSHGLFDWEVDSGESGGEDHQGLENHGDDLEEYLLKKFALGMLDAQSVCVISWMAVKAGAKGDGLARMAVPPEKHSSSYMRHLRKLLPMDTSDLFTVPVPAKVKGSRGVRNILMAAPHIVLQKEADKFPDAGAGSVEERVRETEWADSYFDHPLTEKPGDTRTPIPCALYLDGIKFTRSIGPRQDSLLGITCYSILTGSRHLIATLSKREMCGCGCRGWDTLMTVFDFIKWSLEVLGAGTLNMLLQCFLTIKVSKGWAQIGEDWSWNGEDKANCGHVQMFRCLWLSGGGKRHESTAGSFWPAVGPCGWGGSWITNET